MTQAATFPPENSVDTLAAIALNICNHLLAFQKTIDARPLPERFPTMPELNMLCKMMNCLEKIKRMQKAAAPTRILYDFLSFVKQSNADLAPKVASLLSAFTGAPTEKNRNKNTEPDGKITQVAEYEETIRPAEPQCPDPNGFPLPTPDPTLPANAPLPPVTFDEFVEFQHVMLNLKATPTETTLVNGTRRNTNWLQYNLYQWCLPPEKRKFHYIEHHYSRDIHHLETKRELGHFLESHGLKPTYR